MINLKGQQFGGLLVKEHCGPDKWGHSLWFCKCKCGKTARRTAAALRSGGSTSCGCQRRTYNQPVIEMLGKTFGRLEVKKFAGRGKSGEFRWECACECGGTKTTTGANLRHGVTQSCGCLLREISRKTLSKNCGRSLEPKRKSDPPDLPAAPRVTRHNESDMRDYRVNSRPHEHALAAAGISFA
jgi:hypothetical protein